MEENSSDPSEQQDTAAELEQLLDRELGGRTFSDALKRAFLRPTLQEDLSQKEDEHWIPEIACSTEAKALANALEGVVDALAKILSVWSPIFWYISLQQGTYRQQRHAWKRTSDDLAAEREKHGCDRDLWHRLWKLACSPSNFIRHPFQQAPLTSLCVVLLLVWWQINMVLTLIVTNSLKERAYFVGTMATNSRLQMQLMAVLWHRNLCLHMAWRNVCRRGLLPFASIVPYAIPAFNSASRHLHKDNDFLRKVAIASVVWSLLIFFNSEIVFCVAKLLAVLFRVLASVLPRAAASGQEAARVELAGKLERLKVAIGDFEIFKTKFEYDVSFVTGDEVDSMIQNTSYVLNLGGTFARAEIFGGIEFHFPWKSISGPKLALLLLTEVFVFLEIFPFLATFLLLVAKIT